MTVESYESGDRRAGIDDVIVSIFRFSAYVRRSKIGVWKVNTDTFVETFFAQGGNERACERSLA